MPPAWVTYTGFTEAGESTALCLIGNLLKSRGECYEIARFLSGRGYAVLTKIQLFALSVVAIFVILIAVGTFFRGPDARDSQPVYFSFDETNIGDATNATIGIYHNLGETLEVTITGDYVAPWFEFRIINHNGSYNPVGESATYLVQNEKWAYPRVNIRVIDAPIPLGKYSIDFTIDFPGGSEDTCMIPIEVVENFECVWWYQPK